MYELKITATGDYVLSPGSYDQAFVSGVSFTVKGFTGSITVQKRQAVGNLQNYTPVAFNCSYVNANSDAYVVAGTAVTADGQYLVSATAQEVVLHVTAVTGTCSVVVTPVEGAVGASGGGASSAVTIADGADAALGSTTDAAVTNPASAGTLIALTKGLLTAPTTPLPTSVNDATGTQTAAVKAASTAPLATDPALVVALSPNGPASVAGTVASGASATGLKPVVIGAVDFAGSNVQNLRSELLNSTSVTRSTVEGLITYSQTAGFAGNFLNPVAVASGISTGNNGAAILAIANLGYNGGTWDFAPISAAAGAIVKPYAFPSNDWSYVAPSTGIQNTTAVTIKGAAAAGIKNYVTWLSIANSGAAGTEVIIRKGAGGTVIYRDYIGAATTGKFVQLTNPISSDAAQLLEVVLSSGTTVAVYVNAGGYTAA